MAPDQESDARVVEDLQVVTLDDDICVPDLDLPRPSAITNGVLKGEVIDNDEVSETNNISEDGIPIPNFLVHQPEEVQLEWLKVQKVGAGLANLGNSCFLNTVIQCLTYCPPLANYLLQEDHSVKCKNYEFCMMCELTKHIKQVFQRSGDVIKPLCIHQNLKFIAEHFQFGRQEDAHEFLRFVVENLWRASLSSYCEEQKLDLASRETTIINHIFGGYNRSQVRCLRCKKKSDKYEHFMDFILDIKHASHSIEKALENFIKPELLENDNAYNCPKCKTLVQAEKTFTIHRAPNVATIQLKRFDYNRSCGGKVTKHISYPERLNLRPYMSENKDYPLIYKLNAVLVHAGQNCTSGHYYCYIRNSNDNWYLMDDARVQRVSLHEVLNQQAYVLFYLRLPIENGTHFKKNGFIPVMKDRSVSKNYSASRSHSPIRSRPQRPFTLNLNKRQAPAENSIHQKVNSDSSTPGQMENGITNGYNKLKDKQGSFSSQNGGERSYSQDCHDNGNTWTETERPFYPPRKYIPSKNYNYSKQNDTGQPRKEEQPRALRTYANQSYLTDSTPNVNGGPSTISNSQNCSAYSNGYDHAQSEIYENGFKTPAQDFSSRDQPFSSYNNHNRFVNDSTNNYSQSHYNGNRWSHKPNSYPYFNRTFDRNYCTLSETDGEFNHRKTFSAPYYTPYSKNNSFDRNGNVDTQQAHGNSRYSFSHWNGNCSKTQNINDLYSLENGENCSYRKLKNSGHNGVSRWNNDYSYERFHYDRRNYDKQENGYSGRLHRRYKTVNGFHSSGYQRDMRNHPYRPAEMANHRCSF